MRFMSIGRAFPFFSCLSFFLSFFLFFPSLLRLPCSPFSGGPALRDARERSPIMASRSAPAAESSGKRRRLSAVSESEVRRGFSELLARVTLARTDRLFRGLRQILAVAFIGGGFVVTIQAKREGGEEEIKRKTGDLHNDRSRIDNTEPRYFDGEREVNIHAPVTA